MTPRPPLTFTGFTPAQWAEAKILLEQQGISLEGDAGKASHAGVTISYAFDAGAGKLELDLVDRKFFDPSAEAIEQKLRDAVAQIQKPT